jgi:hypothetical protein
LKNNILIFFFENKYSKKEKKFKIPDLKRIKTILLFEKRKYVNRKEKEKE